MLKLTKEDIFHYIGVFIAASLMGLLLLVALILAFPSDCHAGITLQFKDNIFTSMNRYFESAKVIEDRQLRLWEKEISGHMESDLPKEFKKKVVLKILYVVQLLEAGDRENALRALREAEKNYQELEKVGSYFVIKSERVK